MRCFSWIGLCVLGCSPAVRQAVPLASHDAPLKAEPVRWRVLGAPESSNWIHRLPDGPAGTERYILGGDRVEKANGRITYAKQSFVREIESSCPGGDGFIHFTNDRKVYWSKPFLGDAVEVGITKGDPFAILDE